MRRPTGAPAPDRSPSAAHRDLTASQDWARKVEVVISLVLRVGVFVSVTLIAAGLCVMFAHHSAWLSFSGSLSYHKLTSSTTLFPHSLSGVANSIAGGHGRGIVVLGVLLLILTPVTRVAVGVVAFLYERDVPMTLVTLYVLIVLVGSFFLAGV